ncbi:MAG: histidine phosphotransferase family protein [Pseudomonadota bacterium]
MIEPALLTAYVASRICHDVVSPVSSVTSALDLINDPNDPEMRASAEELLHKGAADAAARIEFLRYAYGTIGLSDGAADIHEAKRLTEGFAATHKPSIEWDIEADHLSFSHARLMMNLVLIGIDSLPRGGVIGVKIRNASEGLQITVSARGMRARVNPHVTAAIEGTEPEDGWSARTIQPLFARMIADNLGARIAATAVGDEQVTVSCMGIRAEG